MTTAAPAPTAPPPDLALPALPTSAEMYAAISRRDGSYEGVFFTAVRTTGIFCRPTCPARKPRREHVEFFGSARAALAAGYRPCLRCRPLEAAGETPPWLRELLAAIERDPARRWSDADLRAHALDPGRVRRWFRAQHGMTFQAYARARRLGHALGWLRHGGELSRAAYEHGYESLSGFRSAFEKTFRTPAGRGVRAAPIVTSRLLTPLGPMVAAAVDEGLCLLEFADRRMLETQLTRLSRRLRRPLVPGGHAHIAHAERELAAYFDGTLREFTVPLILPGTDFQRAVWARLREIPYGETSTYERQARAIGAAGASRAVGRANGDNRIAIIIPCHRVVRSDGQLCGYGGGLWRKRHLLDHEGRGVERRAPVRAGSSLIRPQSLVPSP